MDVFNKIESFYKKQHPFVVYRKPNSDEIFGVFLEDDTLFYTTNFKESGFVFSPFDDTKKTILFPLEKAVFISEKQKLEDDFLLKNNFKVDELSKEKHINLVEKAVGKIHESDLEKVIISRKELVQIPDFNLLNTYKKLLQLYKNAFVYVWFHPKVGLWFGATPETLLEIENNSFKTMSLAGTQVFKNAENIVWKSKELEEQQLVTNFIVSQLQNISSNLKIDKTENVKAGNVLHLKTKVTGYLKVDKNKIETLIKALHPTPAVCGLPREKAKDFILKNENYDRTFYTGFLGELNFVNAKSKTKKSSLFVNLRCMNIKEKTASVFVGGGITKDSNAEKEWEETVSKSKTMKQVL